MTSGPTDRLTTLWEPPRPVASLLVRLPVIVLSSAFLGLLLTAFVDNRQLGLIVSCSVAAVGIVYATTMWFLREARRVVISSDTAIGVRSGTKTVFDVPWANVASIKLDRGDSLVRHLLDITDGNSTCPHFTVTGHDRWAVEEVSPELAAFLPKDYQLLAGALADECRRRSVPFGCD